MNSFENIPSIRLPRQIVALSELLVTCNLVDTQRKATSLIKQGRVYIGNLRVANPTALYILLESSVIQIRSKDHKELEAACFVEIDWSFHVTSIDHGSSDVR